MSLSPELITLIIGTILGSVLGFGLNQLDKCIRQKAKKKKAMMCLKIELRKIKKLVDTFVRTQSRFGPTIPTSDILELDMATQVPQFMFFKETLAEQIYNLSTCLRSANKHRSVASELLNYQPDPKFKLSAEMFVLELKNAQRILNEINRVIDFEQPASPDAQEP